jgi:site-specific DNA-methyltransferase (adenine-specific)
LPVDELQEVVEDEIPEQVEPKSKLGDVWKLGRHRLLCGDSTDTATVQKLMAGTKADLVLTDPPFGNGVTGADGYGRSELGHRYILGDSNTDVIEGIYEPIDKVLADNTHCLVWIQWRTFAKLEQAFSKYKLKTVVVWDKKQPGLGGGISEQYEMLCVFIKGKATQNAFVGNVWSISRENSKRTDMEHPHKKPIEVLVKALELTSQRKDNVLDLFGGSGSTLIACEQTDRTCFMMELDPKYVDVIIARWEKLTGLTAELITD